MKNTLISLVLFVLAAPAFASGTFEISGSLVVAFGGVPSKIITENGTVFPLVGSPQKSCAKGRYKLAPALGTGGYPTFELVKVLECDSKASKKDLRLQRILTDKVLLATVKAVETKYAVSCKVPTSSKQIAWRCLSDRCSYMLIINCGDARPLMKGVEIKVFGYDNGTKNDINEIKLFTLN